MRYPTTGPFEGFDMTKLSRWIAFLLLLAALGFAASRFAPEIRSPRRSDER